MKLQRAWVIQRICFLGVAGGALTACSVDDRVLHVVSNDRLADVGAPNCGHIPDCNSVEELDASAESNLDQLCTSLCPDLNHDNVLDTAQTLLSNPSISLDVTDWIPDVGIGLGWNSSDACGKCDSGSLAVTNQYAGTSGDLAIGGARQCLPMDAGQTLEAMARVKPDAESLGGIGLQFFSTSDCTGEPIRASNSAPISTEGGWQRAHVPAVAILPTQSVSVRLWVGAAVQPKAGFANVFFDDVLVTVNSQ